MALKGQSDNSRTSLAKTWMPIALFGAAVMQQAPPLETAQRPLVCWYDAAMTGARQRGRWSLLPANLCVAAGASIVLLAYCLGTATRQASGQDAHIVVRQATSGPAFVVGFGGTRNRARHELTVTRIKIARLKLGTVLTVECGYCTYHDKLGLATIGQELIGRRVVKTPTVVLNTSRSVTHGPIRFVKQRTGGSGFSNSGEISVEESYEGLLICSRDYDYDPRRATMRLAETNGC